MSEARDLGTQPVDALMQQWGLSNHDMVDASPEQLTHKQVQRARKGRMLTLAMMQKVTRTLNIAVWYRLKKEEREQYFEYLHKHLHSYFLQPRLRTVRKDRDGWDCSSSEPGHRLRAIRKRLGLAQWEMAKQMGVGAVTLLDWENLRRLPSGSGRRKIEAFCHEHSVPSIFAS
ncbi:XRE family transcriptional regulator [Haloferula helveola]|uniref:XRE family transcriptional regulator n=1 Tax=Haloferula helveola TaxID=490095 RepID=A0ABM7R8E5_9BACT|nr:XRE family transcriptional regulator [Haloferula helveola]